MNTKRYYHEANYLDYSERGDRYARTAAELSDLFAKLSLVDKNGLVVDFGCAVGHLLSGFREFGFSNLLGVEKSEWASIEARRAGHNVVERLECQADIVIALDVFEHMSDDDIESVLQTNPKVIVARIPSSTDGGNTFHLTVSRADPTHINCKTKEAWIHFFRDRGYSVVLPLKLYTIYDTIGVSCFLMFHG